MRLAIAAALLFGARFLATAFDYPSKDADVAWQSWLGEQNFTAHALPTALGPETFTASGAPWVPQEWLLGLVIAWVQAHGLFGLLAAMAAALAAGALVLVARRARAIGASTLATAAVTLCTGLAMVQSFGVRAQVGGWFCLALLLAFMEVDSAWALAAIAVVAVWANLHASVLLAPAIAALWTTGALLDGDLPRARRGAIVALGAALATCASPLGYHLPAYAIALVQSPIRHEIVEWQPTTLDDFAFVAGVLPLALAGCIAGFRGRTLPWRHIALWTAGLVAGLSAVRNLPLAAILMAAPTAVAVSPLLPDRWRIVELLRERAVGALVVFAAAFGSLFLVLHARDAVASPRLPERAIAAASSLPGMRRLYCEDFAWCSLALSHANLRTFLDGRCDPFPPKVWDAYIAIEHAAAGWQRLVARYRIDTVLARRNRPLAGALAELPGWHVAWSDDRYVILARKQNSLPPHS